MIHSLMRKYPVGSTPAFVKAGHVRWVTSCVLVLVMVSVLLLLSHGFCAEWPTPPSGQPEQMWSKIDYDAKLTDPFFESNERSHPWYIIKHPDGSFEDTTSDKRPEKEPPHLKHTAKCFSTSFEGEGGKHLVNFCEATLLDVNLVDLFIHESNPADEDALSVQIRNGMFTSEYWTAFRIMPSRVPFAIWTTTRQKLTLDKKVYGKGDVIKGRIDFECRQEITDPTLIEHFGRDPKTIKVYGVFKTVVE
jgi:hypothetical protein